MSASLAAAKKRRAPASVAPSVSTPPQNSYVQQNVPAGLTLPQVIQVVDKRLIALEQTVRTITANANTQPTDVPEVPSNLTEVLDEFNSRFDALAEEIENIKNIVLSLQTYTMDVNKMLLEERVTLLGGGNSRPSLGQDL